MTKYSDTASTGSKLRVIIIKQCVHWNYIKAGSHSELSSLMPVLRYSMGCIVLQPS